MSQESVAFDKDKFKQMLHYIISKTASFDNVGKTVIAKMMYFSDFDYYELNEQSITGEVYVKMPFGPLPKNFGQSLEELKKEGKIKEISASYGGRPQTKFVSLVAPDQGKLNGNEIKQIEMAISKLSGMSASAASAYSHADMPWKATGDKEAISYKLVFYRTQLSSAKEAPEITC